IANRTFQFQPRLQNFIRRFRHEKSLPSSIPVDHKQRKSMSRATFWADHRNSRIELSPMCRVYFRWNAEGSAPSFKKPRTRLEETFSRIVEGNFAQLRRLARSRRSQCRN